ncbi:GerMN domain-containing protein [Nocardioides sp.]|uniref:GerMN domain-containing protein n=1 Tax=Nocardioides sp. TaxID=35761 RepID=UPI003D0AD1F6
MNRAWSASVVVGLLMVGTLASCGLPSGEDTATVSDDAVPFGLMAPTDSASRPGNDSPTPVEPGEPAVIWVNGADRLVALPEGSSATGDPERLVAEVLERLVDGPTDASAGGLSTALAPDVGLALVDLDRGAAVIEVDPGTQRPSPEQLPLAVGQIVLSCVSVPGVDQVQLLTDGEPIDVPLPGGALSSGPLGRSDYNELLAQ